MKLFCKCPLPKVGSPDWPWEETSETVYRKVQISKGSLIPEYLQIDSDGYTVQVVNSDGEPDYQEYYKGEGWVTIGPMGKHTVIFKALDDIVREGGCSLVTAKMPGYEVAEHILPGFGAKKNNGTAIQCVNTTAAGLVLDGKEAELAKRWCEQDARQRWVRQNLLTMVECEMVEP